DVGPYVFPCLVDKNSQCQRRTAVPSVCRLLQVPNIPTYARNTFKATIPGDGAADLFCTESFLFHHVKHHERIQISVAASVRQSGLRREAHARVDGDTIFYRADAGASAQMA